MGYVRATKRTKIFNEQTPELQKKYFGLTRDKFLPTIDNLYYGVYLYEDSSENKKLTTLIETLEELKKTAIAAHESQEYKHGLMLDTKSFGHYKYCLSDPDKYDIFISGNLLNMSTPRIVIQIRAFGLWIYGAEKMLTESFTSAQTVFKEYNCEIEYVQENRIDYCYHTNIISQPDKYLSETLIEKQLRTQMRKCWRIGRVRRRNEKTIIEKDYIAFGDRLSNNVFVRIYNKGLEVVEKGYKQFFFEIWHENGLINLYDKYCLEYVYGQTEKNYDYINKGRLYFYLEYGHDDAIKKEIREAIDDGDITADDYKKIADKYLPEVTNVMNIEYETKRKFYYYSDSFIDNYLEYMDRADMPKELRRLYRIIDNRTVFMEYLTRETLAFVKSRETKNGKTETIYTGWWDRLRNTKLDGKKTDEKLLREYSKNLDEQKIRRRLINNIATRAVYNGRLNASFDEDAFDMLSHLNDNHKNDLRDYFKIKNYKEKILRNRINKGTSDNVKIGRL